MSLQWPIYLFEGHIETNKTLFLWQGKLLGILLYNKASFRVENEMKNRIKEQ